MAARCLLSFALLLGGICFLIGCKPAEPDPVDNLSAEQRTLVQAIDASANRIADADPTRDFADLAPLDSVVAQAQVVGLGEATHGTREFFQMKDRIFRYLVQKFGHQAMGFEANFGRAELVNRFIHGQSSGLNTAGEAAKSMYFWTWSTNEVRDMLQWMRAYNATRDASQQISFFGFDCQYADDEFPLIREFFAQVEPGFVAQIDSLAALYQQTAGATTDQPWQAYSQRLPALYNLFISNESKWVAAGNRQNYEVARQAARVLVQHQDLASSDACNQATKRDRYMAENIQWAQTRMNRRKLSVWAHSGHVADLPTINCGNPSMGAVLKQQLKDNYVIIGTSLSEGKLTVRNSALTNNPISILSVRSADEPTSFNYLLGKSKYYNFILRVRNPATALANWLNTASPFLLIGAGYNESKPAQGYYKVPLTGSFDALVHFRSTSPTQGL